MLLIFLLLLIIIIILLSHIIYYTFIGHFEPNKINIYWFLTFFVVFELWEILAKLFFLFDYSETWHYIQPKFLEQKWCIAALNWQINYFEIVFICYLRREKSTFPIIRSVIVVIARYTKFNLCFSSFLY